MDNQQQKQNPHVDAEPVEPTVVPFPRVNNQLWEYRPPVSDRVPGVADIRDQRDQKIEVMNAVGKKKALYDQLIKSMQSSNVRTGLELARDLEELYEQEQHPRIKQRLKFKIEQVLDDTDQMLDQGSRLVAQRLLKLADKEPVIRTESNVIEVQARSQPGLLRRIFGA